MQEWKKAIFVNAIRARAKEEGRNAEEIAREYTKLTEQEREEILQQLNMEQ